MGQHYKRQPKPMNSGLGIGFWTDLQNNLNIAVLTLEANSKTDTSSSEVAFDPDENTVTDLITAVADIVTNKK